ncbi:MAG TPA: Sec-independent protein translocase protein TatB [Stellaceae bacterium]|jgi:sec-independent protein translocase protein TatB|nr:Sec-independent protein translocase protein TatB [Stellaceae bacterium]
MFDFAWSELALIAVVALVVIGPKDLPRVMRIVGQWTRRARSIAREFQGSLDQMVREAELDDVKRHIDRATSFDVEHEIRRAVDPSGELQQSLNEPVLANPLADPPKPVETMPLPPVPEPAMAVPTLPPPPVEAGAGEDRPPAPEPEKQTP